MDIVSRLKSFLQESGIAYSQFADNCEIPRPTLSQLLNGRNKKVSDEIIAKIHRAYPALSIMWLMFGDGDMLVPNANSDTSFASAQLSENVNSGTRSGVLSQPKTINFGERDDMSGKRQQPIGGSGVGQHAMAEAMQRMARMSQSVPQSRSKGHDASDSRVVSIMVFYSDGRFETFAPQM